MATHYGIWLDEDCLDLIKFLNGGILPPGITEKKYCDHYFCFAIDSQGSIVHLKNPIRTEDSLWNKEGTIRKNDRVLLIG